VGLMLGRPDDTIWQLATTRPDELFVRGPVGDSLTYGEFARRAGTRQAALADMGVGPGDRVILLCRNSAELLLTCFAAWGLDALVVPVNLLERGISLGRLMALADPAVILVDDLGTQVLATCDRRPSAPVVPIGSLEASWMRPRCQMNEPHAPASPAMILFSSGTTGTPKGCVLSHEYLAWCGETFCVSADISPEDSISSCNQLCHINAWWAFLGSVVRGVPFFLDTAFSATDFWPRAADTKATVFDYVGVQIPILLKQPDHPAAGQSRLRVGLGGGTGPDAITQFAQRFGVHLLEAYGLTECCLPIFQKQDEFRLGTMGKCSTWVDAKLVDRDGSEATDGQDGELWLRPRSPRNIFSGYWRRDDLTKAAFSGPWFKTADLCRRDGDGYYSYVGRLGHVIRSRGENVSPFVLESVAMSRQGVSHCAALGVPSEFGDADILLAVEPVEGAHLSPEDLHKWCRERVATYSVPRYVSLTTFPVTSSGRVEREKLDVQSLVAAATDFGRERAVR
jgi:carnitine-CoA ligase